MEPVTVFLVAVACLLVGGAAAGPLAARTGIPEAVWLVGLGALMRISGAASPEAIAALAPFFGALALIMVLFEAGRDLRFGSGGEVARRARWLASLGALLALPAVAVFSQALSGLNLLPTWSWTHALMLGALMLCTAPEVFTPALRLKGVPPAVLATLEREAALTGALAIAATATCIDLLSLHVGEGEAAATIAAGFGLGLAFGAFAGLLWIAAVRRLGPTRGVYPYTLAGLVALHVVTGALGGIGALAVLVFGAIVANAGTLVAVLFRPRGEVVSGDAEGEDFAAALSDHSRTVEIVRVLLFTFIGLGLGPAGGLLAMGVVLGLLLAVIRLFVARVTCRGLPERDLAAVGAAWPRGMVVAGLAALPHAAAVPGTQGLTTLVFAAVATSCVAFALGLRHLDTVSKGVAGGTGAKEQVKEAPRLAEKVEGRAAEVQAPAPRPAERTEIRAPAGEEPVLAPPVAPVDVPADAPVVAPVEVPVAPAPRRTAERTEIRVPTVEEVLAPTIGARSSERTAIRGSGGGPRTGARVVRDPAEAEAESAEGGSVGGEVEVPAGDGGGEDGASAAVAAVVGETSEEARAVEAAVRPGPALPVDPRDMFSGTAARERGEGEG